MMMLATTTVEDFDRFLSLLDQGRREAKAARIQGRDRLSRSQ